MPESPAPQKINVRSIISIFENHSTVTDNESTNLIRRAKSMTSLSHKPVKKIDKPADVVDRGNDLELLQITQEIQHLQKNCTNNYKTYSRENHIYYQNQIVFLLTDLSHVDGKTARIVNRKSELSETLKKLNKKLNSLLPATGAELVPKTVVYETAQEESEEQVEFEEPKAVEDEPDAAPVSVKSLKEMFEKNSRENEGKSEPAGTKLSRKFFTFNSNADFKYVAYSEKFKSNLGVEVNGFESVKKEDVEPEISENVEPEVSENVEPEISEDSLSLSSSSEDDSESEDTVKDEEIEN